MSLARTIDYVRKGGLTKYWRDMQYMGDAKWGTFVGTDANGNKYWENLDEQPGRTRWVDFREHDFDSSQLDPIWHAWVSYIRAVPPSVDQSLGHFVHDWQLPPNQNFTGTRGAFKTYNTTMPKLYDWMPQIATREG